MCNMIVHRILNERTDVGNDDWDSNVTLKEKVGITIATNLSSNVAVTPPKIFKRRRLLSLFCPSYTHRYAFYIYVRKKTARP